MRKFIRIGIDLGKRYFQFHGLESEDGRALKRKLRRSEFLAFMADVSPCQVYMEACGAAHYWGRELAALGHEVRLMPPLYVKPYVKRGKSDAVDAAACCEAGTRSDMRFVAVKSAAQQAALMQHKTRALLVKQRTMAVNALRGHLSEFGIVAARGIERAGALIEAAERDEKLPDAAKAAVAILAAQIRALDESVAALDAQIAQALAKDPLARLLTGVPGVGPLFATALRASLPDPGRLGAARDFSAWLGLTPRQNATGGKERRGAITKQGDKTLRRLLVLGATSLLRVVAKRTGALRDWIVALLKRKPARLVTLALANKLARIVFAIMISGEPFRREAFARV